MLTRIWLLSILFLSSPAFGQFGSQSHQYRASMSYGTGKYEERSKHEFDESTGEKSGISLTGQAFKASAVYLDFDFELDARLLFPAEEYFHRRSEFGFNVGYYWPEFVYVAPFMGYTQVHQQGNRNVEDAPPAFITRNRVMSLGLKSQVAPYMFDSMHGTLFQSHIAYLTSFEKQNNFGLEYSAGLGYLYVESGMKINITIGHARNYFNGTVEDKENEGFFKHVRHIYTFNTVSIGIEM